MKGAVVTAMAMSLLICSTRGFAADDSPQEQLRKKAEQIERQERQRKELEQDKKHALERFAAELETTCDLLAKLQAACEALYPRLDAMQSNDDGKRLALDSASRHIFSRIRSEPAATVIDVKSRRRGWDELLQGIKAELTKDQVTWLPDPTKREQIVQDTAWAPERLALIEKQAAWLDAAVAKAKDANILSAPTLQEALAKDQAAELELVGEATERGRAQAMEEMRAQIEAASKAKTEDILAARIAALNKEKEAEIEALKQKLAKEEELRASQRDKELAEKEAEIAKLRAQQAAAVTDAEVTRQKSVDDTRKKALIAKCQSKEIQDLMAPFTAAGRWQPGEGNRLTLESKPVSLSALRACRALEKNDLGLRQMACSGMKELYYHRESYGYHRSVSPDSDRPKWGNIPADTRKWTKDDVAFLNRVQDLISELGPTMVELGMLSE